MIDSYTIQCTYGKKGVYQGKVKVSTPDDSGDMLVSAEGECGEERSISMRVEEARLLARVLLQAAEENA